MNFAYADPPYLGCGKYYTEHHPDALDWDRVETHQQLIDRLMSEFDGWALSLHSPSLKVILPMCPPECRIGAWVKPFCSFKPNVNPAFAWEPVIFYGARKRPREVDTVRDWVAENITLRKGLTGAKPIGFCLWILDLLGFESTDTMIDLFPGTGVMGDAIRKRRSIGWNQSPLFFEE